jgi:hypothetical protein
VPTPGVLGATLFARGSDVRPVRANAKWVYHSHDFDFGPSDYWVTARSGASANQVIETTSDDPAGTTATTVTQETDGSIRVSAPISLGGPSLFTIAGYELRSPVRVNDQYVLFDGEVNNVDADGDGRADRVKVAYWRVVVGHEQITLPNQPVMPPSLRVDSFVAVEVTPSGGGGPVRVDLQTSNWYQAGVGLVRVTVPSSVAGRAYDVEDVLTGWDGVVEGRGYITQPEQVVDAMLTPLRSAQSAVALTDGVLVATASGLHRLDRNGVFQATLPPPPIANGYRLLGTTTGILAVSGVWPTMQLHSFSGQGQYVATTGSFNFANGRPTTLSEVGQAFAAHPANPWLWVAWSRSYESAPTVISDEVVVRAVRADGTSPFPELTFPATSQARFVRLVAGGGAAMLVWNEQDGTPVTRVRTVRIDNLGGVVFNTTPAVVPLQLWSDFHGVSPVWDGDIAWLSWTERKPTATPGVFTPDPHGLRLDAAGQPIGDAASASLLPTVDPSFVDWNSGPVGGVHIYVTGADLAQVFPNDAGPTPHMTIGHYTALDGPLASTIGPWKSYRVPLVTAPVGIAPIEFNNGRVLILSERGGFSLRPTVFFR